MQEISQKKKQYGLPTLYKDATPAFILVLFLIVPALVYYLFPVSSNAAGSAIACVIFLAAPPWRPPSQHILFKGADIRLLVVAMMVVAHFLISATLSSVNFSRFFSSLALLILFFRTAVAVSSVLYTPEAGKSVRVVFFSMIAFLIIFLVGLEVPSVQPNPKSIFPFAEPSFFALAFVPLLLWISTISKGLTRYIFLLIGIAIGLILQNLTMIVGVFLILLITTRLRHAVYFITVIAGAIALGEFDIRYYTSRLEFSLVSENISTLVYIQGWQLILESLANTWGWGLGFQQLGLNGTNSQAADLLFAITGENLNLLDGGFLFSKLASDFGAFGIAITLIYLNFVRQSIQKLRQFIFMRSTINQGTLFAHAIVVSSVIDMFVRGIGFFTGSIVLLIAALIHLYYRPALQRKCNLTQYADVELPATTQH